MHLGRIHAWTAACVRAVAVAVLKAVETPQAAAPCPTCAWWRERLPPILAGTPAPDTLRASTFDAVVHLVEVRVWAEASGLPRRAVAAEGAIRGLLSTMAEDDLDHLGAALALTLHHVSGSVCIACKKAAPPLKAIGRVEGGRCSACWDVVLEALTARSTAGATVPRTARMRVHVEPFVFVGERTVSFAALDGVHGVTVDANKLLGDLLEVRVVADVADGVWIELPGDPEWIKVANGSLLDPAADEPAPTRRSGPAGGAHPVPAAEPEAG